MKTIEYACIRYAKNDEKIVLTQPVWRGRLALHSRISPTRLFASRLPMVVYSAWGLQLCMTPQPRLPELYPCAVWCNCVCVLQIKTEH
ncbi:MAG: hypothetical protein FWC97_11105 [Treponema sp.]|nr:hypothetical protein [Treponema sp.]